MYYHLPTKHTDIFFKDASLNADKSVALEAWYVDADYIPTLQMMAAGRNFSPDMPTDSSKILINEAAARMLGYTDALNKNIYSQSEEEEGKLVARSVIGVVKDFNTGSLRNKIPHCICTV